ncbi:MAG: 50S ribosomal protein L35 [Defluviitaleaceae bacterium]|nr:50S ribosomal protein L35 [Defluviitaleaceae bacterium]
MPKLKTKKAAAKRFQGTGTGKIKKMKSNKTHILGKKSPKRKRNLRKSNLVNKANVKSVKQMLPYLD